MFQWKLRDIVLAAILAVVSGLLYMGWDFLFGVVAAAWPPVAQAIFNGVWWIAAGLVGYIIRRVGAAFFGELVAAFCEFAFGSPYGPSAVLSGLLQGIACELGFAIGGYRRFNTGILMLSGGLGGVGYFFQNYFQYGGNQYTLGTQIGYLVVTIISGAFFAGLVPNWIGDALKRTGVLRNFAIGRQDSERVSG